MEEVEAASWSEVKAQHIYINMRRYTHIYVYMNIPKCFLIARRDPESIKICVIRSFRRISGWFMYKLNRFIMHIYYSEYIFTCIYQCIHIDTLMHIQICTFSVFSSAHLLSAFLFCHARLCPDFCIYSLAKTALAALCFLRSFGLSPLLVQSLSLEYTNSLFFSHSFPLSVFFQANQK